MADIVLVHPYLGEMDAVRDKPHLPLPLIQAAALAAQEYEITLVDLRVNPNWQAELRRLLDGGPLLVGLSVMSGRPVASAVEISDFVRAHGSTPIVWGGHHPTLEPAGTIDDPSVDVVVIGEGEETLLEIARRYADGKDLEGVAGCWFKRGDTVVKNPARDPLDLETLPLPPYRLVDVEHYVQEYRDKRMLNLETSRGCWFKCTYCYHSDRDTYHRFRAMSVDKSLERMFWARDEFGVDGVYLVDDNFFLDRPRGLEIARQMARQSQIFYWQIQGVDVPSMLRFSGEKLETLAAGGLQRISVGAESGSPRILKFVRKPHTLEMLLRANRLWSRSDVRVYYSFVAGFPDETADDLRATIDLMFRLIEENPNARTSPIYNFLPFPGSRLWHLIIHEHGYQPPPTLRHWGDYDWNHVNVPYLTPEMRKLMDGLYWPSLCIDHKFEDYGVPSLVRWGSRLYRPVARTRMRKGWFGAPVERYAARAMEQLLAAGRRREVPWTL